MTVELGFAFVGCGRIAQKYAHIFSEGAVKSARLVAAADLRQERAEATAKRLGAAPYTDFHRMMDELGDAIDVVCVMTESGSHVRHTVELAPYGKHIVVEKPMALTVEDADRMIDSCDTAGVKLFVVKQNRFNLPVVKMREALEAGRLGRLVMGTVRVRWTRRQDYYDQDAWRGTWAQDGGVFANQASHHIDLLEWCMGRATSVFARASTALVDIEAEDTGIAVLTFENGALGIIEATTATRPKDLEGSISILGEGGTVEIGGFAMNEMKTWRFEEPQAEDESILAHCRENPPDVYGFGHVAYLNHVVDAVLNGAPSLVDGLGGRKSVELITAICESIARDAPVAIGFGERRSRLGRGT